MVKKFTGSTHRINIFTLFSAKKKQRRHTIARLDALFDICNKYGLERDAEKIGNDWMIVGEEIEKTLYKS